MNYENIVSAKFISRLNRFVATVEIEGREVTVHVKNTGRCRELLTEGATVYLEDFSERMGKRKLCYDLIAVKKGDLLINMDSQAPNKVVKEALESGTVSLPNMTKLIKICPERVFGDSRFDFYISDQMGKEGFVEVKGVTLEKDGVVLFPDAPTERGIKHLKELALAKKAGYEAYIIFVIQMSGVKYFTPNDACHLAFGDAVRMAAAEGVAVLAYECTVSCDSLKISKSVPICLGNT